MNEEEIVRLFLENGFQISKGALGLVPEDPKKIISHFKKTSPRPFIITEQHIKNFLGDISKKPTPLKTIKEYALNRGPIHVKDYVKGISTHYTKIKPLLLKQMALEKLVSINKITARTLTLSIIGLVRKKNNNSILIEDPTGETSLYFDENIKKELKNISLDDVIGVRCKKIKEKYYVKRVFNVNPGM